MELSEERLVNWLERFEINEAEGHEPIQIHTNGHAAGPEIQAMIEKIEPEILIPIHTEHPERFENPGGEVVEPVGGVEISL